jgi:hypothetical protein
MSAECLIENLVLAPVALAPAMLPADAAAVTTSVRLTTPSGRRLQLTAPFFVRHDLRSKADGNWDVLCGLLRRFGLPLFSPAQELESVSAANVPARIAARSLGQPIVKSELTTCDAFELANCDAAGNHWGWPYEIEGSRELKNFVQVLREATGSEVPIGMSLPIGAAAADIRICAESSIDFLTLRYSADCLAIGGEQVASLAAIAVLSARRQCAQLGRADLPLLLDAPLSRVEHAIKLLALGATAVNVGAMVFDALPSVAPVKAESKLTESLLGSFAPATKSVRELPAVEQLLQAAVNRLRSALQFAGQMDLAHFDCGCLRATTKGAAELTGIPLGFISLGGIPMAGSR